MDKLNLSPWLSRLLCLGTMTAAVTVATWGGPKLKLWNFFTKNTRPASSSSICGTIATPQEKQKPESSQDCTSVIARSQATNLIDIETPPQTALTTLTSGDSYRKYEIRKREALIRELESRISISTSKTALIEGDWNSLREDGFSEEFIISTDSNFQIFPVEKSIRKVHREQIRVLQTQINDYLTNPREPTKEQKQQQKNEILRVRISRRQRRILELDLLIQKSNAITEEREAEWTYTLTATALRVRGLRKKIIMDDPAFKQLEADKVRVLADEQARRITYWTEVWVLRDKIKKDQSNIREPKEAKETSLPRE